MSVVGSRRHRRHSRVLSRAERNPHLVTAPTIYDHLRPTDDQYPDGVYRVVGTGDSYSLLRVGDADGRRINTGDIVTVARDELDGFEPAPNPDNNRPLGASLRSILQAGYWSVRTFVVTLAANPLPTVIALAAILVGNLGSERVPLPERAFPMLIIAGAFGLAYIGSGRLD